MVREIRDMREEDIPDILLLLEAMTNEGVYSNYELNHGRSQYVIEAILGQDGVFTQCFVVDGVVRGFFAGQVVTHEFVQCHVASDLGFYIDPEYRKGTWGIRLIKNFEAWCMSEDVECDMIRLSVFAGVANARTGALLSTLRYADAGTLHVKEI